MLFKAFHEESQPIANFLLFRQFFGLKNVRASVFLLRCQLLTLFHEFATLFALGLFLLDWSVVDKLESLDCEVVNQQENEEDFAHETEYVGGRIHRVEVALYRV